MIDIRTTKKLLELWLKTNGYVNGAEVRVMALGGSEESEVVATFYHVPDLMLKQIRRALPSLADVRMRIHRS